VTRTRVAAVVMIPLAILLGILGGHYWHATHTPQAVTLADQSASPAPGQPSTPSTPATPTPAAPAQPTEQAKRDPGPVVAALPKLDATKPEATKP
jgi:cell division protein FtsN